MFVSFEATNRRNFGQRRRRTVWRKRTQTNLKKKEKKQKNRRPIGKREETWGGQHPMRSGEKKNVFRRSIGRVAVGLAPNIARLHLSGALPRKTCILKLGLLSALPLPEFPFLSPSLHFSFPCYFLPTGFLRTKRAPGEGRRNLLWGNEVTAVFYAPAQCCWATDRNYAYTRATSRSRNVGHDEQCYRFRGFTAKLSDFLSG